VKPILFVAFQLVVLGWTLFARVRHDPSPVYKALWLAAFLGVIGLDVWYFADYAYPNGFAF
jgi:hypothetical protein